MDILRKLLYWISGLFYKVIPDLYGLLYDLAGAKLFQDDTIKNFSTNLYLLVSVVMLFVFGVQLIKAIVNPDLLTDNKKGTAAFVKRAVLSVVIITVIPIAFNTLYTIQDKVIENSLIEKIVVGFEGDKNELDVGQYLSASLISELLYPEDDEKATFEDATALGTYYNNMLNSSVDGYYDLVGDYINERYESSDGIKKYSMHYEALVMLISGIIVCYILVTACMDMALRLVKLAMLELIAPISIIAYLIKGDDSLSKWVSEVVKTYAIVFLKLGAISMVVFGFQQMQDMFDDQSKYAHPWIMRTLIMIGLLTLINELPNLIQSLFGVSFQFKGGVKGRLGNMFGPAGKIAQETWGKVTGGIKGAAAVGALGAAGAIGAGLHGAGRAIGWADKNYNDSRLTKKLASAGQQLRNVKNSPFGRQVGRAGNVASSTIKAGGGIKGLQEGYKAYKDSALTKDIKAARQNMRDDMAAAQNAEVFGISLKNKRSNLLSNMDMPNEVTASNPEEKRKAQLQIQQDRISVARDALNNIEANVSRVHLPKGVQTALLGDSENMGLVKANTAKKVIDEIKNCRSNAETGASELVNRLNIAGHSADANKLSDLSLSYKQGAITANEYAQAIKTDFVDKGLINKSEAGESIIKHVDQAQSLVNENKDLLSYASRETNQKQELNYDQINGTALNILSGAIDGKQASWQEVYDNALKQFEGDATLTRDIKLTASRIDNVIDDYVLETKGNKFDSSSATSVLNEVGDSYDDGNHIIHHMESSLPPKTQTSDQNFGDAYYPSSYDDFYNEQPKAQTPNISSSNDNIESSTPERVVERETIREVNNSNNNPTTLDNVTINANDINTQNMNTQGFNSNQQTNLDQSEKIVDKLDEMIDINEDESKKNNE